MKNTLLLTLLATICSSSLIACDIEGKTGFAPENDLNIPANIKSINGITEEVFNQVIDDVEEVYAPIVKSVLNKNLKINRKWTNGTVNANANQMFSWLTRKVTVNMYGGLARHEKITADGFAIVLCHEIGHHLAGAPKVRSWASNEGQSDYFATLKCFRKVYGSANNVAIIERMNVPQAIQDTCQTVYTSQAESALCIRSTMAAKSTSDLLTTLRNIAREKKGEKLKPMPKVITPDTRIVKRTFGGHPEGQCRLDTYFAGAICDIDHNINVDKKDPKIGTCNRSDKMETGVRPLCWFKPQS